MSFLLPDSSAFSLFHAHVVSSTPTPKRKRKVSSSIPQQSILPVVTDPCRCDNVYSFRLGRMLTDDPAASTRALTTQEEDAKKEELAKERERIFNFELDYYQLDRYSLVTDTGLTTRAHDFVTMQDTMKLYDGFAKRCTHPDCHCLFDPSKYGHLHADQLAARKKRESKPLTLFLYRDGYIPCRLCKRCLFCLKPYITLHPLRMHVDKARVLDPYCVCGLSADTNRWKEYHRRVRLRRYKVGRAKVRLIYYVCTIAGAIPWMYDFFMTPAKMAVGMLALALLLNFNDTVKLFSVNAPNAFLEGLSSWVQNCIILLIFAFIVAVLKFLEFVYSTVRIWVLHVIKYRRWTNIEVFFQLYKRIRFTNIGKDKETVDRNYASFGWVYYSDDDDEGMNDPDIAHFNFSLAPDVHVRRRCRRTCLFSRY